MGIKMIETHKKEVIAMYFLEENTPRCRIYWADGGKFKCNICTVFFDMPMRRDTATKAALLAAVLKEGCIPYPTPKDMAIQSEEMYGAKWDISVVKKGERQLVLFSLEIPKQVDMEEGISFLKSLILEPLIEQNGFLPERVNRKKKWLKTYLESMQDDKRAFAQKRCLEETAKGSAYGISGDGYVEDLEWIDAKNLYDFYLKMIQQAKISVVFVGDKKEQKNIVTLRKSFLGMAPLDGMTDKSFIDTKPNFLLEKMAVGQSRLVLGFHTKNIKYGTKSYATYMVLNRLLGEGANSLLFQNLREEKSLCYDIGSGLYPLTGLVFVQMGIQKKDAERCVKGVLQSIKQLWKEPISSKKLKEAKSSLEQEYEGIADSPWRIANFIADGILMETDDNLESFLQEIGSVTAKDIMKIAKNMRLQTIYLLANEEGDI